MGIQYLIIGFAFFFLPNLSIIDILPDFIGCLFIIKGLSKFADLTPVLMDAKKLFFRALYIYIAKFVLMFSVPFFANTDGGYILIFTFTFAVLDLVFTLPAFKNLHDGFTYLGDRTNASVLFKNQSEFSTMSSLFLITRAVLTLIPDLSYISSPDTSGIVSNTGEFYISNYKTLLTGINFLITGIVGIVWLVYAIRYFNGIKRDVSFMSFLEDKYKNEVLSNNNLFIRRNIKNAFLLFTVGAVFMLDFLIDYVNILPDFLGAFFVLMGAIFVRKYIKSKMLITTSVIATIFSTVSWVVLCLYAITMPGMDIWTNIEAYELFVLLNITNAVKYIAILFMFIALYRTIINIVKEYTGSPVDELKSIALSSKEKQLSMYKQNKICLAFGILCCVSGIVRMFLLYDFAVFGIIDFLLNVLWIALTLNLFNSVNSSVEYKYL